MDREKINDIDSILIDLEVSLKKASVVCTDLGGEYFGYSEPSESMMKLCYADAEARNCIVLDYLHEMKSQLKELQALFDKVDVCEKGVE